MDLQKLSNLKDLQAILDLMKRNDLAELEIEEEGRRIRLRKSEPRTGGEGVVFHGVSGVTTDAGVVGAGTAGGETAAEEPEEEGDALNAVNSPLVGTFYRASSPEEDPFVQEGDRVDEDSVLCIVEAMKVMNEIRSGVTGIVREILVRNGEPVEFGQPLFRVETE